MGNTEMGFLSVAEVQKDIPFEIRRVYWTYGVPPDTLRGMHAHKKLEQAIFALHGSLIIDLDNGKNTKMQFTLDSPNLGLYIPIMWWRNIRFSPNAVLLSLASEYYSEDDYFRDHGEFVRAVNSLK